MAYQSNGILRLQDGGVASTYMNINSQIGQTVPSSNTSLGYFTIQDNQNYGFFWMMAYKDSNDRLQGQLAFRRKNAAGTAINHNLNLFIDSSGNRAVSFSDAAAWREGLGAVNIAGDTMTGKLILNSGLSIKSGAGSTNPPYFLCLLNSYANGGDVGYVASGNMAAAIGLSADRIYKNIGTTSVATATDTTIGNTGSLSAGVYVVMYRAAFATNTTGRRVVFLASSTSGSVYETNRMTEAPAAGAATELVGCTILELSSATTIYLRVYQNSGGALDVTGQLKVIKIHG